MRACAHLCALHRIKAEYKSTQSPNPGALMAPPCTGLKRHKLGAGSHNGSCSPAPTMALDGGAGLQVLPGGAGQH